MKTLKYLFFLGFLFIIFGSKNPEFYTSTKNTYKYVDNKKTIIEQKTITLRLADSLPVSTLTKVYNYNNDYRIKLLSGLSKKDGLKDYLLDNVFYDNEGNDTLKKYFVSIKNKWTHTQIYRKAFRKDKQIESYMTERAFDVEEYYRKEICYKYNINGQLVSESEYECNGKNFCDSTIKKEYIYNPEKKLNHTNSYIWHENKWEKWIRKVRK